MDDESEQKPLLSKVQSNDDDDVTVTTQSDSFCGDFGDPSSRLFRVIVLVLMCFIGFGSNFCFDNPAVLHDQLRNDMGIDEATFMQLYSWYSWPNVVLCFFGGFLLDRVFGIRLGSIIFSLFVLIGQLIFAFGATVEKMWLMDLGRFVFGIGGESLVVVQSTYAVLWFKGKELNLVFGLQLSMATIGSTVNMNVMEPVYNMVKHGIHSDRTLGISLFISALTCLFSLGCALALAYMDKRAEKILHRKKDVCEEKVKLTDVITFPVQLWLVFIICIGYYVAIFPFISLGKAFFQEKFGYSPSAASAINSIIYILSSPCSPVFGFIVDKVGYNIYWVLVAVVTTLISHGLLAFTFIDPWLPMCIIGVAYALPSCALWPMVAYLVPPHRLATAYGFTLSTQNLGVALMSMASGKILDQKGYFMLEIFFCACVCLALIATLLLYLVDLARGSGLNLSTAERDQLANEEIVKNKNMEPDPGYGPSAELLRPMTAFKIRNRYYSKIGAQVPEHLLGQTNLSCSCASTLEVS